MTAQLYEINSRINLDASKAGVISLTPGAWVDIMPVYSIESRALPDDNETLSPKDRTWVRDDRYAANNANTNACQTG